MFVLSNLKNLDLLSVGVAVAGMIILGFVTFFNNPKSITNKLFLCLSICASTWGLINYFSYQGYSVELSLWLLRFVMFFAVWSAFFTYALAFDFPAIKLKISSQYRNSVLLVVFLASLMTLTPLVFKSVIQASPEGEILSVENGPGIIVFALVVLYLNFGSMFLIIRKIMTNDEHRKSLQIFLLGIATMLFLIMIFNFLLPAFFNNPGFVQFGALFMFPFIAATSYAILRHHLFSVKVITTEILTFILAIVSFFEVVIADNPLVLIFRSGILVLILSFGVLLIKSVRNEVEQREKLEQLNKELEEAKLKLEDLSRFKTQLLSLASHQIKSPLAAIKGFISIMLQGLYGPIEPKIRDTLEKMKHSSDELIDLINSVLDLRKVEEGKMEYSFEKVSLTAMVKGVIEEIQPLATGKGLKLETVLPQNEIFVQADKTKLKQVVQNLIDNSIKYTLEGFVRASLKEEDGPAGKEVVFSVTDSGLGLSETLLPHLFSEFVRDDRVKKEIRGTGFGLYIAKGIIEAHGGKIWAESPGEGKGSTFAVRLKEV